MINPNESIVGLQEEIRRTIKDIQKAKGVDQRHKLSEVLCNLTRSLEVYLDFVTGMMESQFDLMDDEFDEEDDLFDIEEDEEP